MSAQADKKNLGYLIQMKISCAGSIFLKSFATVFLSYLTAEDASMMGWVAQKRKVSSFLQSLSKQKIEKHFLELIGRKISILII